MITHYSGGESTYMLFSDGMMLRRSNTNDITIYKPQYLHPDPINQLEYVHYYHYSGMVARSGNLLYKFYVNFTDDRVSVSSLHCKNDEIDFDTTDNAYLISLDSSGLLNRQKRINIPNILKFQTNVSRVIALDYEGVIKMIGFHSYEVTSLITGVSNFHSYYPHSILYCVEGDELVSYICDRQTIRNRRVIFKGNVRLQSTSTYDDMMNRGRTIKSSRS